MSLKIADASDGSGAMKHKPIRVLRLIARLNIGGPAIHAISLTRNLSKDYQTLLVCGNIGAHEGDMDYLARENHVKPLIIPTLVREISLLKDLKTLFHLIRILQRYQPRIIHTHTAKAGTIGRIAALWVNATRRASNPMRLVHTFHGHVFHSYFGRLKTFLFIGIERLLARFTDKIVVISAIQKIDICEKFKIASPQKVKIIPLGFDFANLSLNPIGREAVRSRYLSPGDEKKYLVGSIGRLTKIKNHLMLFKAIALLSAMNKIHLFRFVLIGDGELSALLADAAEKLNIRGHVIFSGWHKDMASIYDALDAVVSTSRNEGTPVSLIEAMACQKPVLATCVGGVLDLLGRPEKQLKNGITIAEYGFHVPSEDFEALAHALLFIWENQKMVHARLAKAKDFAFRRYALDRLLKDISGLYAELGSGK